MSDKWIFFGLCETNYSDLLVECECFCFGSEAVNESGEAAIGLVIGEFLPGFAREGMWRFRRRSPAHASRQQRRLGEK